MNWKMLLTPVSYEDVAKRPPPGTSTWIAPTFSTNELSMYFLFPKEDQTQLSLFRLNLPDGDIQEISLPNMTQRETTLEEDLRRQRLRVAFEGVTSFEVLDLVDHDLLLVNLAGYYFVIDPVTAKVIQDLSSYRISNASHVPLSTKIAAVSENQLITIDIFSGHTEIVARPSKPHYKVAVAEYVAQEELDRLEGYWFSKNGRHVAYCEVDETHIPQFPITHVASKDCYVEYHRYPFVGKANANVTVYVVTATGNLIRKIATPPELEYVSYVKWLDDETLLIQYLNRFQSIQKVFTFSISTDTLTALYCEEIHPWINAKGEYLPLDDATLVTTSERSGHRHLCIIRDGTLTQLTTGDFDVLEILSVDKVKKCAYLLTNFDSPLQQNIQRFDFAANVISKPLTIGEGLREVTVSNSQRWIVERFNNLVTSARINIYEVTETGTLHLLEQSQPLPNVTLKDLGVSAPQLLTVPLDNGEVMYGALYLPPDGITTGRPVVLEVYGGPHFQMVKNGWHESVDMQAQLLAQNNIVVAKFDNRGSFGRGKAFEAPIFRSIGTVELEDQIAGLQYVHENFKTDRDRVGVFGWSYGGFMTLSLLAKKPDLFRVGVAGAPVVDFSLYDTAYTERYMHTPGTNPEGYANASILNYIKDIKTPCLIVHGLTDENVHFRNTAQLIEEALQCDVNIELMLLPEARHMPTSHASRYALAKKRTQFLVESLL